MRISLFYLAIILVFSCCSNGGTKSLNADGKRYQTQFDNQQEMIANLGSKVVPVMVGKPIKIETPLVKPVEEETPTVTNPVENEPTVVLKQPEELSEESTIKNALTDMTCLTYTESSFKLKFKPKSWIYIKGFSVVSNQCGLLSWKLTGDGVLSNGKGSGGLTSGNSINQISMGDKIIFLAPNKEYTLTCEAEIYKKKCIDNDEPPLLGNVSNCQDKHQMPKHKKIEITSGTNYIFDLQFKHE